MRSFLVLVLLGVVLLTIGLAVRSGLFLSKHPGEPINAAMRQAEGQNNRLSADDLALIEKKYPSAKETGSGLRYVVVAPGHGSATPSSGQLITVNYTGRLLGADMPFDASADHGGPFHFVVGEGSVIPGWDEALLTMHKGEKRTLIIPYWLAYGEEGVHGTIPPRTTLVFDVELVDF